MTDRRRAHGATILAIRQARGLTMATVVQLAHITPGYLSKIENGLRRPEEPVTARLAAALGVQVEHLTGQLPVIGILRTMLGITYEQLAHDVGISTQRLGAIETGADEPTPELLAALARRLGVDPDALNAARLATT